MAWLAGYSHRKKIIIPSNTYLSSDLSDMPIVVHLDSGETDFWDDAPTDGTHVRVTQSDGETLLTFYPESYDDTGNDAWWLVDPSTLLSASATEIYIYYGHASPSDGSNKTGVWASQYKAMWPLNEDSAGGAFDDNTSGGHDFTNDGTISAIALIDKCRSFDGVNDDMSVANHADFNPGASEDFFFAFMFNTTISASSFILVKGFVTGGTIRYMAQKLSDGRIRIQASDGTNNVTITTSALNDGNDHDLVASFDRDGDLEVLVDGASIGTLGMSSVGDIDNTEDFMLGDNPAHVNHWGGKLDYVIFAKGALASLDWAKIYHQIRLNTWLTIGAVETGGGGLVNGGLVNGGLVR